MGDPARHERPTGTGRELWLFTMRFPYGAGEAFIESELPVLLRYFDRVRCIPMIEDAPMRKVPDRVDVEVPVKDLFRSATLWECLKNGRVLLRLLSADMMHMLRRPSLIRPRLVLARQLIHRYCILRSGLFKEYEPRRVVLYSYWTTEWATLLGLLHMHDPRIRSVSRVHGFDLFEDRPGDLPFRKIQLEQAVRIYAVSQAGLEYIAGKYPACAAKFHLARLGTADHGPGPLPAGGTPTVVSCSSLIPRKRVHLIAEALSLVGRPLNWVHFGDGPLREDLHERIARMPAEVNVRMMRHVANSELMIWYRGHAVDVVVHVARAEGGVAVALQEAASFGIPIVAVDAGGVGEVVGHATGILLHKDPDPAEVAAAIREVLDGPFSTPVARQRVRDHWQAHFRAAVNHAAFCEDLLRITDLTPPAYSPR